MLNTTLAITAFWARSFAVRQYIPRRYLAVALVRKAGDMVPELILYPPLVNGPSEGTEYLRSICRLS